MFFEALMFGTTLLQGQSQRRAANRAAEAAREVGEFNAKLIERDAELLERQREIINRNAVLEERQARYRFRQQQGSVVTAYSGGGIDVSEGTPMAVLRQNAREFEYDMAIADFNLSIANMQINDQQESARLDAELSRMEGGAQAAALRAQGRSSFLSSVGQAARIGYETKLFKIN